MNKTKDAIKDFMTHSGHHDTTVHETVQPAIKKETLKPTEHEDVNIAIDKEIHQDHYHRTVQPVFDKEVLPEQHKHNFGGVQHREYDHRDQDKTKHALTVEGQKFRDERTVLDATHTQSHAPTVQGEHIHHHLHETIQPVVHKEIVQPSVIHTTVPIHEVHHNAAQHHSMSSLPPVSMEEYKKQGGALGGRDERFDAFEGDPKNIKEMLETTHRNQQAGSQFAVPPKGAFHGDFEPLNGSRSHQVSGGVPTSGKRGTGTGAGAAGGAAAAAATAAVGRGSDSILSNGASKTGASDSSVRRDSGKDLGPESDKSISQKAQRGYNEKGSGISGTDNVKPTSNNPVGVENGMSNISIAEKIHKPSLLNRLNPLTDSNGDGKAGFMK